MSLINPAILYGLALAAIPVLLHFLMRSKPKKLLFPALRLIRVRRKNNVRRMRLRHIWLLLLRVAVIGLLVLAISRPSLPAADYSFSLGEWLRLAAIVAVAAATYWGVLRYWRRQRLSNHTLTYRRTLLRGGTAGAAVLLFGLLVAWPYQRRIAAEISAPLPATRENLPVAGVFLFDTSLSMQYRSMSKTRLDEAKEIAGKHLSNLPPQSRIAVADTSTDNPILFQADLSGAQARINRLEIRPVSLALNDRLRTALRLQEEDYQRTLGSQASVEETMRTDRYLREIYLLTDLARSGWQKSAAKALRDELSRLPWVQVYVIDVGVEEPTNVAVSSLSLSKQTLPLGGELILQATIEATGAPDPQQRTVELYVHNADGNLVKQGQSTFELKGDSGARVTFAVHELTGPIGQGEVRLVSSDPLASDDVRFFTVEVRPPPEVLLTAESPGEALLWLESLAPRELVRQRKARYRCRSLPASRLETTDLSQYEVVCLMNVPRPSGATWDKLAEYVKAGGGLAVFLGMPNGQLKADPVAVSYNSDEARSFLPAELLADLKFTPPEHLDLGNLSHPIFHKFEEYGGAGLLTSADIRRYWRVEPLAGAAVIARYTDRRRSPALLERAHGEGRTVMVTTAVDRKLHAKSWNDLPLARWQFVALADQLMQYLGRRTEAVFNYTAGDEVLIRLNREQPISRYLLRKPGFQQLPGEVAPDARYIAIHHADELGHYEIVGAEQDSHFTSGFSVNPSADESDFTRLVEADLDVFLGQGRYSVAPSIEELERIVTRGRIGQEVFSLILFVVIAAFCTEHVVANRFYDADQTPEYQ